MKVYDRGPWKLKLKLPIVTLISQTPKRKEKEQEEKPQKPKNVKP